MPVYKLIEMPYEELLGWFAYFEARPVGWREDERAFKLLQAQGVKAKPEQVFVSLAQLKQHTEKHKEALVRDGMVESSSLKRSMLFSKMLAAKGGDKLEVLND